MVDAEVDIVELIVVDADEDADVDADVVAELDADEDTVELTDVVAVDD